MTSPLGRPSYWRRPRSSSSPGPFCRSSGEEQRKRALIFRLISSFERAPRAFHNGKRFERRRRKAGGGGSVLFGGEARERAKKLDLLKKRLPQKALRSVRRAPKLLDLAAETRNMTFLVCRIRGFAAIVESFAADPEGLSRLVRRALTPMVQAVHDRGGTIDRMVPGGLTAFFNAPLDDPDHAVHACEAALSMLNSMEKVNRVLEQGRHPDGTPFDSIGIGIGLNTGPGIVGNFGTESEPDYAATGHAVAVADDIEKLSANYGTAILVGHPTRALAERSFAFLEVDVLPEGGAEPATLFALLGSPLSRANPKFLALK